MPRPLPAHVLALTQGDPDAVGNHILDAARRVIASKGLAGASTRAIADEAGVSGGTLYNYFGSHVQLLAKAVVQRAKDAADPVASLPSRAGQASVAENLRLFVRRAATVLDELIPTLAAAFSDAELLDAVRRELTDADPLNDPARVVERYLLAERDLGRVAPGANCRAAARLVVSICHDDAFNRYLVGETRAPRARREEIALIARSVTN
jgi:AcrR family transcriptional regulator